MVIQRGLILLLVSTIGSFYAQQSSGNTVQRLFDKQERKFAPPPKSLRANRGNQGQSSSSADSGVLASGRQVASQEQVTSSQEEEQRATPTARAAEQAVHSMQSKSPAATLAPIQVQQVRPVQTYTPVPRQNTPHRAMGGGARSERRRSGLSKVGFSGQRIFGFGLVGAGPYGIFGGEVDFMMNQEWSAGFGLGTGMAYNTWGLHARRYLHQSKTINTFLKFGYANWHLGQVPRNPETLTPSYLAERFLSDGRGNLMLNKTAHLLYPSIGLDYQHPSGLAFAVTLQYLIGVQDFSGALYGSLGAFYYF